MTRGTRQPMLSDVSHQAITGTVGGVPYVALPPPRDGDGAPLVVAWHMMDPPWTEAAMAAALPLAGVPAWRVYLGLPMFGARTPAGGFEEVTRLGAEDFPLKLFGPVVEQAAAEAPAAIEDLRRDLGVGEGPIGLVGGSMGSAVALLLLAEGALPVSAAAVVSPVSQLAPVVGYFDSAYPWTEESRAVAERFDFVARAAEIARADSQPGILLVAGERDAAEFREPAAAFRDALLGQYADPGRVSLVTVPEMAHAIAKAPGLAPAPQTPDARRVDAAVTKWFRLHLRRENGNALPQEGARSEPKEER
jgi:dienelactone hydrolase